MTTQPTPEKIREAADTIAALGLNNGMERFLRRRGDEIEAEQAQADDDEVLARVLFHRDDGNLPSVDGPITWGPDATQFQRKRYMTLARAARAHLSENGWQKVSDDQIIVGRLNGDMLIDAQTAADVRRVLACRTFKSVQNGDWTTGMTLCRLYYRFFDQADAPDTTTWPRRWAVFAEVPDDVVTLRCAHGKKLTWHENHWREENNEIHLVNVSTPCGTLTEVRSWKTSTPARRREWATS